MGRKKQPTFEEALTELESITRTMENGDLLLTDLMKQYAHGVELAAICKAALTDAEKAMDAVLVDKVDQIEELRLEVEGDING
ncbi:hypothetical protein TAMA11512_12650 [Selenomonas sp. TAMA-11512]|uniref:exodeoxyribonuclease VII small subunit n=1 Tax=Selenomonas sp. TAMA-11512 TaxID=3095337 RepID=UPI00308EBC16|nr:hypothetical protein TAMA11512_12650 [Selenomonas sp. TAMA-11512]